MNQQNNKVSKLIVLNTKKSIFMFAGKKDL